jgi:hypothetical protein
MEAELNPYPPCKAVAAFLDQATAFFHVAWMQHLGISPEAPPNEDLLLVLGLAENGNHIQRALKTVAAAVAPASGEMACLLRDCVKIGGDLVIRIDRVAGQLLSSHSASGLQTVFCDKWRVNDLAVLAMRLEYIIERLSYVHDAML